MSEFKREERYTVVKHKDISTVQLQRLRSYLATNGMPTRTCVVVEPDWPIYGLVWQMVESLANGKVPIDPKVLAADLNAALEREKSLSARVEFLNQQNTEQQEQNEALAMKAERLTAALNYSCEYLNSNHLNTIVHRSKAHMEMISAIQETAIPEQEEFSICPDCEGDGNIACVTCPICDGGGTLSMEESARLHAERLAEQINNCELECGAYGTYCKCAAEAHK